MERGEKVLPELPNDTPVMFGRRRKSRGNNTKKGEKKKKA